MHTLNLCPSQKQLLDAKVNDEKVHQNISSTEKISKSEEKIDYHRERFGQKPFQEALVSTSSVHQLKPRNSNSTTKDQKKSKQRGSMRHLKDQDHPNIGKFPDQNHVEATRTGPSNWPAINPEKNSEGFKQGSTTDLQLQEIKGSQNFSKEFNSGQVKGFGFVKGGQISATNGLTTFSRNFSSSNLSDSGKDGRHSHDFGVAYFQDRSGVSMGAGRSDDSAIPSLTMNSWVPTVRGLHRMDHDKPDEELQDRAAHWLHWAKTKVEARQQTMDFIARQKGSEFRGVRVGQSFSSGNLYLPRTSETLRSQLTQSTPQPLDQSPATQRGGPW